MSIRSYRYLLVVAWFLSCVATEPVFAQSSSHSDSGVSALPVIVDGAKSPELIPDLLAMRHFVHALANDRMAMSEVAAPSAVATALKLSSADATALVLAVDTSLTEFRAIDDAYSRLVVPDAGAPELAGQLSRRREAALDAVARRITESLSIKGTSRSPRLHPEPCKASNCHLWFNASYVRFRDVSQSLCVCYLDGSTGRSARRSSDNEL